MDRDEDRIPFRQATRLINEFQRDAGSIGLAAAGLDLDRAAALLLIFRIALRTPGDTRISVNALAASLRRPTETIRRAALGLTAMGFCAKGGRGVQRHPDFLAHPAIVEAAVKLRAIFDALLDGFERSGFRFPATIRVQPVEAILIAALDIYLSVFELAETRIRRPMDLYVLGSIAVINAEPVTRDTVLGERYGYDRTVPPEALRRPATIRDLVQMHGFPHTTIWRHVTALERSGALRRVPAGYLIADRYMDDPETSRLSRVKIKYVRRILNDLAGGRSLPVPDPAARR